MRKEPNVSFSSTIVELMEDIAVSVPDLNTVLPSHQHII